MSRQRASRRLKPQSTAASKTFGDVLADTQSEGVTARVVGNRIIAARKRRSMNQSDLARATGLSRTVVNGYEKGRHLPGARELARMCSALRIGPNELLYGVADPFAGQELKPGPGTIAMLMIHLLEQNERESILTLMRSLLEFRHGKQAIEMLNQVGPALIDQVEQFGPKFERAMAKAPLAPSMKAFIEGVASVDKKTASESPRKPRPRPSARRSR